jgi:hypothetical protein
LRILFSLVLIISLQGLSAYDTVIKDKYGRVTGYLDKKDDKTYIVDKYGKRGDYIESDGDIKDKYGRRKGKVEIDN